MNNSKETYDLSLFVALGCFFGTAMGGVTGHIGIWLPIGVALGISFGAIFGGNSQTEDEDR